ncbi:MAG: monovalent cation/H(+) antiporter subunit G [Rickettsiales bacterium]|jgi:multicomponent Na+:H+ antiporter subunit G|nr:monovalent cation/H(+) antiporter subunit G [Rickettsiales bacterium]
MIDILSYILISLGLLMILSAVIGCHRLPDYFTKMHSATVGDVIGCPLVMLGLALQSNNLVLAGKISLLAIILLIVNPTASYILNQIALRQGLKPELKKDDQDV